MSKLNFTKLKQAKYAIKTVEQIDEDIKSIAVNKFAVNKVKNLKKLGKSRQTIIETIANFASVNNSYFNAVKTKANVLGFDKKFLGLKASKVIEKVNTYKSNKENTVGIKTNPDTDTVEDIEENNQKIYNYLLMNGEIDAANYILNAMSNNETLKSTSDTKTNDDEIKSLAAINEKIYEKLDEIEENMVDEQDTAISIPEKLKQINENEQSNTDLKTIFGNNVFNEQVLKIIEKYMGNGILGSLLSYKSVGQFIAGSAATIWAAMKLKVDKLAVNLIKKITDPLKKSLNLIKEKIKAITSFIFQLAKKIPIVDKILKVGKLVSILTATNAAAETVKNTSDVKPIEEEKPKNTSGKTEEKVESKPEQKTESNSKEVKTEEKVDNDKKALQKDLEASSKEEKPKNTSGKTKPVTSKQAKQASKALRLLKGVPGLGVFATAAFTVVDTATGYLTAASKLGIDPDKLNETAKISSAAGGFISGITFNLLDDKNISTGLNNLMNNNEVIKKFEDLNVLNHNSVLKSKITNWDKVAKLDASDIKELIGINDFSDEDLKRLFTILKSKVSDIGDDDLKELIKKREGLYLKPYRDGDGYSVGYGHFIKPNEKHLMNGITKEEAEILFEQDFVTHKEAAMKMPNFEKHPKEIQNVLIDMTYNLGANWWSKWNETPKAIINQDYSKAAKLIKNTKYASDTGNRAIENANTFAQYGSFKQVDMSYAKKEVSRNTKMIKLEETYNKTVESTQQFNSAGSEFVQKQQKTNMYNINSTNTSSQKYSAFDLMP